MSGHLRSCFAAFVLLTGFSTSPASSNPFDFLFKAAPEEAAAPTPARAEAAPARAEDECLPHPGKSTDGQYWVYRLDGHRKCWHQVDREVAARKLLHHRAAPRLAAAPEEDEAAPRKRKQVVDARAELPRSAPVATSQPTPPAPELKVVDAAAVPRTVAAMIVPPAPVVAKPATDQFAPQVDVDTLLAAAPAASDAVAGSVPPPTPAAVSVAEAGDDGQGWTPTWLGVLLMSLGFVSLLISSWTLRGTFALGPNK
jgi:hypothetical protein